MQIYLKTGAVILSIFQLVGCGHRVVPPSPSLPPTEISSSVHYTLTGDQVATLHTLEQVDPYPLYTMTYMGTYRLRIRSALPEKTSAFIDASPTWACSLFSVLVDEDNLLYGRNFDWQFSPALMLFTDPPDGYASVSMVDIAYLGYDGEASHSVTELPISEQIGLLDAPYLPFDGMNEHGLAIGMAAVPPGNMPPDENKQTIGSLGIIRQMLDRARTVDEAVEIMKEYNIEFGNGPPIHYLMADATGKSALVEYFDGEMHVIHNEQHWHLASNFLRASEEDAEQAGCWRYNKMSARLTETDGLIDARDSMQLLADVAQNNTQWSVIYQMSTGKIDVVMGRDYQNMHQFQLGLAD